MQLFDLTLRYSLDPDNLHGAGYPLAALETRAFKGGQHKMRPLVSVRGEDVFVVPSLHAVDGLSVNDLLVRLLLFIANGRDYGAARITAVVTWLPCPRKDRVTKPRDPVCSRYLAQLFEAFLDPAIGLLTITDTAETIEPPVPGLRLRRLSVAPMIGRCLARMHSGRAISPTLEATGLSH